MAGAQAPLRLILWDIDHTLIETGGLGAELYGRAFEIVTGQPMRQQAHVTGQTEPSILTATLRLHGIDDDEPYLSRYLLELPAQYELQRQQLRRRGRALPGADEALMALDGVSGVIQTVLTGNLRAVAQTKLHAFGMDRYVDFRIGAYGDDDSHRPSLVAIAQQRAGKKFETVFDRSNTTVIGDSTHDVDTGLQGGARVVAVASGGDSAEALQEAGADLVLPNLIDTERVVAAFFS